MNIEMREEVRLKRVVREAIQEAFEEEFMKLRLLAVSYISDEEQKEIESSYLQPSKKSKRTLLLQ
ncbi:MAG: hypothetical protein NTX36_14615 [Proteobacteria bacterium]|nr:hypothetical protein [Pseudomonadota bacterium]